MLLYSYFLVVYVSNFPWWWITCQKQAAATQLDIPNSSTNIANDICVIVANDICVNFANEIYVCICICSARHYITNIANDIYGSAPKMFLTTVSVFSPI